MLIRKITQDTSVVCDVSTHSGLFRARTRSGIMQILKYLHSYWAILHSPYKYIIKILILFTGWLGRDQDDRGKGTSKGDQGVGRFTAHQAWDTFPKEMKYPGSWSTCFPLLFIDMRHGFKQTQWPWLPCQILCVFRYWSAPPQESLQSSDVQSLIHVWHRTSEDWRLSVFSPPMCDVMWGLRLPQDRLIGRLPGSWSNGVGSNPTLA